MNLTTMEKVIWGMFIVMGVLMLISIVAVVGGLQQAISSPEQIGHFFGQIAHGFNSAIK